MASNETGVSKDSENADFLPINYNISEMIEDRHIITMENNRKSHTGFPLPFSGFNGFRGFDLPRQQWQGRRHGFESGGTILRAERAKTFF